MSTIHVASGGDLQAALNAVVDGDIVTAEANATFLGNYTIPNKGGTSFTLRTDTADGSLPSSTTRISPSQAAALPTLRSPNSSPALATESSAHNWNILGINFQAHAGGQSDIITLGDGAQTSYTDVPINLVLDRCLIQGDNVSTKRGVALNSSATTIKNCYISAIRTLGQDSQAICGWNGPGTHLIDNNFLEAAGENIMFGGADPQISGLVPTDIIITNNHLFKRLAWKLDSGYNVKNLFELKNGKNITIENNVFENSWPDAQIGYGVVFSVRNQDETAPQSTVQNVTFQYNIIAGAEGPAVAFLGKDDRPGVASTQGTNMVVKHLLVDGTSSMGFMISNGFEPTSITHTTMPSISGKLLSFGDDPMPSGDFTYQNNVAQAGLYGITGSGLVGVGVPSLDENAPASIFNHNVIGCDSSIPFPASNTILSTAALAGLINADRSYTGGEPTSDSGTMGADIAALKLRIPWYFGLGTEGDSGGGDVAGPTVFTLGGIVGSYALSGSPVVFVHTVPATRPAHKKKKQWVMHTLHLKPNQQEKA